jgi:hypothetical protein
MKNLMLFFRCSVIITGLLLFFSCQKPDGKIIPFPEALTSADIVQTTISHPDSNGIIIGNGDINALIYSANDQIIMHLAKNDVWDARLITEKDPPLLKVDVKNHTWTGGGQPASWDHPYPTQTPPAMIRIDTKGAITRAHTDLTRGCATLASGPEITTIRALATKNVYYIETGNQVTIEGFAQPFLPSAELSQSDGLTIVKQHLPPDPDYTGMDVYTVLGRKGSRYAVAVVTTRESPDAQSDAVTLVKSVLTVKPKAIIREHENDWQQFWSRSGVDLSDQDMQNWWYRQLYYFRCLSKPGAYAIALQGGYNSKANWHGTWTMNYNAQQTFWPAFSTNHVERTEPFIELVNEFHPRARWYARTVFDCEGAVTPHNFWPFEPDPEQCVSFNKRQLAYMPWSYGIGTAGHIAHILWLHYEYSGDIEYFREKIYPVIKDYALFYASFIEKCKSDNGKVVFGPSVDPEHTGFGWNNSPYDIAWAQHTLKAAIQGAKDLGVDRDLISRWTDSLDKLPDYPVSGDVVKVGDREDGYNIITPVAPMFPAEQVSWFSPVDQKELFERTIRWMESRYNLNNSVVMLNVARARLSMTEDAWNDTKTWFKGKEQSNGLFYWKAHGFYMTEQTAVSGLITEFLLQSNDNIIRVFPAWPADKDARFSSLRARGGFLVSAKMEKGIVHKLVIKSENGGELKMVSPWNLVGIKKADGSINSLIPDARGIVSLDTDRGQTLEFIEIKPDNN